MEAIQSVILKQLRLAATVQSFKHRICLVVVHKATIDQLKHVARQRHTFLKLLFLVTRAAFLVLTLLVSFRVFKLAVQELSI
jgi:hypothetical protein